MPPRKKAKASAASTPLRDTQPKTPQESGPSQSQDELMNDLWADEQETQLFKSMMKWKPTGLHKHFRMISIHNDMRSHGFATEDAPHTRIPGIWKKLNQLYALDALDERENQYAFSEDPDPLDPDDAAQMPEFELPEDEYGELMWQRRFHREESAAASSPASMPTEDDKAMYQPGMGLLKTRPGSARSQKAETPAEATPTPKTAKSTRTSRANNKGGKGTKGSAKGSKAQSAASESAEEEDEEDEDESSAGSDEDSAPTTRRTNRGRTKVAPKRTRKR
ncbi:CT20-domain-containing protein [Ophiobolus disseminans]|uniref:CT20-domain-containing protein n=1 Tax=Ophiobolus disseminans TaxID=1469910 RepID=A0A6A6ZJH4_9PLEO|nr:CT20-domain-containing protein [Ophiobolus disseminans]